MATKHCCWGLCKSDSRFPDRLPGGTTFLRFPKPGKIRENMSEWEKLKARRDTEKAKRWIHACGRKDFTKVEQIKKDTYICSIHFVDGKPTEANPEPMFAHLTEREQNARMKRRKAPLDRQDKEAPPPRKRRLYSMKAMPISPEKVLETQSEVSSEPSSSSSIEHVHKETQTVYNNYFLGAKVETMIMKNQVLLCTENFTEAPIVPTTMSVEAILKDAAKAKYFIGLFPEQFEILFDFLGPAKFQLQYWYSSGKPENCTAHARQASSKTKPGPLQTFSAKEELFLTLLRLRRGFALKTLAYMYNTSESAVSCIFNTWIQFMYIHFQQLRFKMFPSKEDIMPNLPRVFRHFKNIRCSVDCTEFYVQSPRNYAQQGNVYSAYKHHATFKALIAVLPQGAACFVSDLYEGSIDDVSITAQCGFLDHIEPGDVILADKGFPIQDLLTPKQASIIIPAFLGKRNSLPKEEEMGTRRMAKARIHVERFNERLKKFRLIGNVIPLSLRHVASQMVYVASCLVNFQPLLCK